MNLLIMIVGALVFIGVCFIPGEQTIIAMAGGALFGVGAGSWYYDRKMG